MSQQCLNLWNQPKAVQFRLIGSGGAFLNNWKSMQRSDDYHPPISWLTYEPDYHWLWLIIIDYHWLSWIIIGYHGLSLIATGYHWLSLEIYVAVRWLSSSNSLIDLMSLIGSTDLNQILYWSFGYLAFCEPAWPLTNVNHWPKRQIRDTNLWNCQLISDRNYSC